MVALTSKFDLLLVSRIPYIDVKQFIHSLVFDNFEESLYKHVHTVSSMDTFSFLLGKYLKWVCFLCSS